MCNIKMCINTKMCFDMYQHTRTHDGKGLVRRGQNMAYRQERIAYRLARAPAKGVEQS